MEIKLKLCKHFLLFLNGPENCFQSRLKESEGKVCAIYIADGGLKHFLSWVKLNTADSRCGLGRRIDRVVFMGDNDSTCPHERRRLKKFCQEGEIPLKEERFLPEKDDSDFRLILEQLKDDIAAMLGENSNKHTITFECFGLLGGRRDHEWCNLLELNEFMKSFNHGSLVGCSLKTYLLNDAQLSLGAAGEKGFSILSFSYPNQVEVLGARYDGHFTLRHPSHGLSNRGDGQESLKIRGFSSIPFLVLFS